AGAGAPAARSRWAEPWARAGYSARTRPTSNAISSPRVGLGGGAARARPDLVEVAQRLVVQLDLEGAQRLLELLQGPGTGDGRGHARLVQQPGQGHVGGWPAQLVADRLVLLALRPVLLQPPALLLADAAALPGLAQRPAEQPAEERAPGDHPDPVVPAGRQHLQLDRALGQVVERLLADQAERVPPPGRLVGLDDVP